MARCPGWWSPGLSPRMRGNRERGGVPSSAAGSIPAYAGEPSRAIWALTMRTVYPRVCGGTGAAFPLAGRELGLSPRMRGNPEERRTVDLLGGSIPAYAGEPSSSSVSSSGSGVYPRVCGGTCLPSLTRRRRQGLSPRMRGNHRPADQPVSNTGSIPAYAGEPMRRNRWPLPATVYPRVCGGTPFLGGDSGGGGGLSPRMRGNPIVGLIRTFGIGSIPAYAGEPVSVQVAGVRAQGLSPRMRGNLAGGAPRTFGGGSIPAYAGEPGQAGVHQRPDRVYPRVCGGTLRRWGMAIRDEGLSPRMRGNRARRAGFQFCQWSIPAYAGEPLAPQPAPGVARVYPRVCGGTSARRRAFTASRGLSPRMRGNRAKIEFSAAGLRSIPAYAGEPPARFRGSV